jgi:hypothetical protein
MEKLAAAEGLGIAGCVVPMSAGWSDVGAWDALWQIADKDGNGNVARGDVLFEDSRNTLVYAQDRMVACVGLDDAVIVETPDAVLVARKDKTQNVKQIVAALKAGKRSQASAHRKIHRPWGWYDSIDNGERFQVKRIVVNPGASLSLQMHHHRAEHWIVVKGTAEVTNGERPSCWARTNPPTSRWATCTGWPTRASCPSRSSRCSRGAIWARTTSSVSKTPTAGAEPRRVGRRPGFRPAGRRSRSGRARRPARCAPRAGSARPVRLMGASGCSRSPTRWAAIAARSRSSSSAMPCSEASSRLPSSSSQAP